jgi:hypothetical protein
MKYLYTFAEIKQIRNGGPTIFSQSSMDKSSLKSCCILGLLALVSSIDEKSGRNPLALTWHLSLWLWFVSSMENSLTSRRRRGSK